MCTNKILTIAIPTYNRCFYLQESLTRILKQVAGLHHKIDILVSDNNSSDGTQDMVLKLISNGAAIRYNRNPQNLGMDGNFVFCFKNSVSKYTWLLGDDDLLLDNTLSRLVKLLDDNDFGLVHLSDISNIGNMEVEVYEDSKKFTQKLNFLITFISGNIVKTDVINKIDFSKYSGSLFSQVPVYINAAIDAKQNAIVTFKTMEIAVDGITNGGYNIFEVFVTNYLNILKEFKSIFGVKWYERQKYLLLRRFIYPWVVKLFNTKHNLRFSTKGWLRILFSKYWYEPYFYPMFLFFYLRKFK